MNNQNLTIKSYTDKVLLDFTSLGAVTDNAIARGDSPKPPHRLNRGAEEGFESVGQILTTPGYILGLQERFSNYDLTK